MGVLKTHERTHLMAAPTVAVLDELRNLALELDPDFLRQNVALLTRLLMEAEVQAPVGAERHERTPERVTQRNGYRERTWQTRVGDIELQIPKLREGSYFPSFLEPRQRAERALVAVIQQRTSKASARARSMTWCRRWG